MLTQEGCIPCFPIFPVTKTDSFSQRKVIGPNAPLNTSLWVLQTPDQLTRSWRSQPEPRIEFRKMDLSDEHLVLLGLSLAPRATKYIELIAMENYVERVTRYFLDKSVRASILCSRAQQPGAHNSMRFSLPVIFRSKNLNF